jgi:hypothetical protein
MLAGLLSACNAETPTGTPSLSTIKIEKIGGLGGFGGPNLKSRGERSYAELSAADQAAVDALFAPKPKARGAAANPQLRDGFSYRISRQTATGIETVEVPENKVPAALISSVKDTLE